MDHETPLSDRPEVVDASGNPIRFINTFEEMPRKLQKAVLGYGLARAELENQIARAENPRWRQALKPLLGLQLTDEELRAY